ncbi:MAG: element excision factor XisI family protein [Bacteroidota bacterium]
MKKYTMDKLEQYRTAIIEELEYQLELEYSDMPAVNYKLIQDGTQFVVIAVGWHEKKFIHDLWFHLELIDEKVWFFENNTDYQIDKALVERGIEKEDMVVAWLNRPTSETAKALAA